MDGKRELDVKASLKICVNKLVAIYQQPIQQ